MCFENPPDDVGNCRCVAESDGGFALGKISSPTNVIKA